VSTIFLVAAEASGDQLGAGLMAALRRKEPGIRFQGVGGGAMEAAGLKSLYPISELAVFGFSSVFRSIFRLRARLRETAEAIIAHPPDALILIDSFGFSFRLAKRVRAALPDLPIIKYVGPQVWVWREGRAAAMRPYFDHTLALFPFEPEVHARLGGPPCTYVGHPLLEELAQLRPNDIEQKRREQKPPLLLVMPGSRRSELQHLAAIFGDAIGALSKSRGPFELVLPTLANIEPVIADAVKTWSVKPKIVTTSADKHAAMRSARAAIAASGTATLELALSGVPHIGAYRVKWWEAVIGRIMVKVKMALLPNILLNERVVPELLQEECTADRITAAAAPLLEGGAARDAQIAAFRRLDAILAVPEPPSGRAAGIVLEILAKTSGNRP
jgi:lipid-A-disaccharide synthase